MQMAARPDLLETIEHNPVFRALSPEVRSALLPHFTVVELRGGEILYRRGEPSDSLYVLCAGSLGWFVPGLSSSREVLRSIIAPGEAAGELGILTDQPHRGTVRALRDSTVLRISGADVLRRMMGSFPEALVAASRHVLKRLADGQGGQANVSPRTFAVLGFDPGIPVHAVASGLEKALQRYGTTRVVDARDGRGLDPAGLGALERRHGFLLFVADGADALWRQACIRQADQLLLVANAGAQARSWPDAVCRLGGDTLNRVHRLLLLGKPGPPVAGSAAQWLAQFPEALPVHHVRTPADYARLVRHMTHRATGLVLSGGGARGLAHLGVVRALAETGISIDTVGGTSMGAIIGAGLACEWNYDELLENVRRTFIRQNPLRDLTLPLVALTRGARTTRLLRECFGQREIEDLAVPYFCISANLTRGCVDVHASGPLWKWLRAGAAIPGILPPLLDAGMVHVDGAVMNNLPTDVMADRGVGQIIAVDISAADSLRAGFEDSSLPSLPRLTWQWLQGRQWPSLFSTLVCATMVGNESGSQARRALATHLLTPPHGGIGLLNWKAHDRAIENGYRYTLEYFGRQPQRGA